MEGDNIGIEARNKIDVLADFRRTVVEKALEQEGAKRRKYTSAEEGMTPEQGFDCSGFVSYVIGEAAFIHGIDVRVPRHANEQWREFGEFVSYEQRIPGDLVYFPSRKIAGTRVIGHVGLLVGIDSYIHASGKSKTVTVDALPNKPVKFKEIDSRDIFTHSPAGIKRISLPIGDGRWHVH